MMNTQELLSAVKASQGITSDYRLARFLGVTDNTVGNWQHGRRRPDDDTAIRLCELAGIDPAPVLAALAAERASTPEARRAWEGIAAKLQHAGLAAAVLSAVILSALFGFDGGPDAGAALLSSVAISAKNGLYIM